MTNDTVMFNRWAELAALFEEGQGMVAKNLQRQQMGLHPDYTTENFDALAERMRALKAYESASALDRGHV